MTATRWPNLLVLGCFAGILGWVLAATRYESLALPTYAPITAGLMAVFELGLARVVSQKVRGAGVGRQMHPLQIARAAVLAKASSAGGALLVGFYSGYLLWVVQRTEELRSASHDATIAGLSAGASLLLVVAALLVERACRTPELPD